MRINLLAGPLLTLVLLLVAVPAWSLEYTGRVVGVSNGDTLTDINWDKHLSSILTIGGVILGGILTGVFNGLKNRSDLKQLKIKLAHENEKEKRDFQIVRLEELYCLFGGWQNQRYISLMRYCNLMKGRLTSEKLDELEENNSSIDQDRMFTLAKLYFPSSHDAFQKLYELHIKASSILNDFQELRLRGQKISENHANQLTQVIDEFEPIVTEYRNALTDCAKNLLDYDRSLL